MSASDPVIIVQTEVYIQMCTITDLLPTTYVVRREGNTFTLLVCPGGGGVPVSHNALQQFPECHGAALGGGGVPVSHNALQHFRECHGAAGGGVPCQVQLGGGGWYPARSSRGGGDPDQGGCPGQGGYPVRTT